MPSDNNHIDHFLRQKANEAAIDNSRIDANWQQMQTLLQQPGIVPAKKPARSIKAGKFLSYAAGVIVVATIATVVILPGKKKSKPTTTATKTNPVKKQTTTTSTATIVAKEKTTLKTGVLIQSDTLDLRFDRSSKKETFNELLASNNPKTLPKEDLLNPTLILKPDSKTIFTNFYNELKKPAQEFVINNNYDTTIRCKEGTSLHIPAGSFQTMSGLAITGQVKVFVQEFYSFADIISNKLSTTSGGMPLETGGMLHLDARVEGNEVKLRPGASLDLKMPTRVFDPNMQLFTGMKTQMTIMDTIKRSLPQVFSTEIKKDTVSVSFDQLIQRPTSQTSSTRPVLTEGINWIPAGQRQFFYDPTYKYITVLNLTDNPYFTGTDRKGRTFAKFKIPYNSNYSTDWVEYELMKKYGRHYDKIKVKREWTPLFSRKRIFAHDLPKTVEQTYFVGDSITISLSQASRLKLITREDSLKHEARFKKRYEDAIKQNQAYSQFIQKREEYDFRISNMGWINCDRFLEFPRSRLTDYVIDPGKGFEGIYFHSMLIFEKENAIMPGYWNDNKIYFQNLPVGHAVYLVCAGVKDGKMMTSIQSLVIEKFKTPSVSFEETSPQQFKDKLSRFGNVTKADYSSRRTIRD